MMLTEEERLAQDAADLRWLKAMEAWEQADLPKRWQRWPGYLIGASGLIGFIGADLMGRLGGGGWIVPLFMVAGAAAMIAVNMPADKPRDPSGGRLYTEWFRRRTAAIHELEDRLARKRP